MFNLIVGHCGNSDDNRTLDHSRMLGSYTSSTVQEYVAPGGTPDVARLMRLPTLLTPELQDTAGGAARLGRIDALFLSNKTWRFRFTPTPGVLPIPAERVEAVSGLLEASTWELNHTHWAVKEGDLYSALFPYLRPVVAPQVFPLPISEPQQDDLVAVMMPFSGDFQEVYDALRAASSDVGLRCKRADSIWKNAAIMHDISSLLWHARIVISDFSGQNSNVFYETGIAHTLGKDFIHITQNHGDVPFDVRPFKYIPYYPNREGLDKLQADVTARLRTLVATTA